MRELRRQPEVRFYDPLSNLVSVFWIREQQQRSRTEKKRKKDQRVETAMNSITSSLTAVFFKTIHELRSSNILLRESKSNIFHDTYY